MYLIHPIQFYLLYFKPYLPLAVGLLLPCLVWLFYRPDDKARRSATRKTFTWLSGFVLWVLEPAFFYFWTRKSGLDGGALAFRTLMLCLVPALISFWLLLSGRATGVRRHLPLILVSWCGAALAVAACRTVGAERYALLDGYFRTEGAAYFSEGVLFEDRFLPMQAVPLGEDMPLRVAYEDGGTDGLTDFFNAEKPVVLRRTEALTALRDRVLPAKYHGENGLPPQNGLSLLIGPEVFFDRVKLGMARADVSAFRAYVLAREEIHSHFYVEWQAAINSTRMSAETRQRIQADFDQNMQRAKTAEKRIDEARMGMFDATDALLDLAQRGMGGNKPNGNGIFFARDEDRILYDQLYQRDEEYQRQQVNALRDEPMQAMWLDPTFIGSTMLPLGPYPPPVD